MSLPDTPSPTNASVNASVKAKASADVTNRLILKLSCEDKPGIVAAVANFFSLQGFNIKESSQFEDPYSKRFFMRTVLDSCEGAKSVETVKSAFEAIALRFSMRWKLVDGLTPSRVMIAVSKWSHCLDQLLANYKRGSLPVEIVGVVSNHRTLEALCEWYQVPFHYLPITKDTKPEQEAAMYQLFCENRADFLVLARYMQVLSDDFCKKLDGSAINIHHSFLPGFKGARPYHQAYERGVKLIGATAHFVTADLDEGPIIEQAVERVTHADSAEQMVEMGRDIEAVVLARAVKWVAEQRVLRNGSRTVVFDR